MGEILHKDQWRRGDPTGGDTEKFEKKDHSIHSIVVCNVG